MTTQPELTYKEFQLDYLEEALAEIKTPEQAATRFYLVETAAKVIRQLRIAKRDKAKP